MAISNMYVLAQAVLYGLIFLVSFFICVPAGVNVTDFKGHCLLHATGTWNIQPEASSLDINHWGPQSACNFTIFTGVMSLVLSLFYASWSSVILARGLESSWLDAFCNFLVNCVLTIFLFSDALTVSIGFREWCELITDPKSKLSTCKSGQYYPILDNYNVDNRNYFTQWQLAQFGVWFSWLLWLTLSVMSLTRLYQYHRMEAFSVSITRERQRLLQKVSEQA